MPGHHRDTCTSMLTAELVTIAKMWNQSKCWSTTDKVTDNVICLHGGVYSAIKNRVVICRKMSGRRDHRAELDRTKTACVPSHAESK